MENNQPLKAAEGGMLLIATGAAAVEQWGGVLEPH